jgi:hypothetical protein
MTLSLLRTLADLYFLEAVSSDASESDREHLFATAQRIDERASVESERRIAVGRANDGFGEEAGR